MKSPLTPLAPQDVARRLQEGRAVLIDIREPAEFAAGHAPGAQLRPLSAHRPERLTVPPGHDVIFTCKSGMRTANAGERLAAEIAGPAYVLEGGVDAWAAAGLPVER